MRCSRSRSKLGGWSCRGETTTASLSLPNTPCESLVQLAVGIFPSPKNTFERKLEFKECVKLGIGVQCMGIENGRLWRRQPILAHAWVTCYETKIALTSSSTSSYHLFPDIFLVLLRISSTTATVPSMRLWHVAMHGREPLKLSVHQSTTSTLLCASTNNWVDSRYEQVCDVCHRDRRAQPGGSVSIEALGS